MDRETGDRKGYGHKLKRDGTKSKSTNKNNAHMEIPDNMPEGRS